jgi:hypothetical protein
LIYHDKTTKKQSEESMDDRVSLVIEVMSIKNIRTKGELCKMLGYCGKSPLEDFERGGDKSTDFTLKFSQYISGWHPDVLGRLASLHRVFPHLIQKKDPLTTAPKKDDIELKRLSEDKFSKNEDWSSFHPKTKKWILDHITPVPFITSSVTAKEKAAIKWVLEQKASVVVAHGEKPIEKNSLLVRALVFCLRLTPRPARYVFFFHSGSVDYHEAWSFQIKRALIFLGFEDILIVVSEFQEGGYASKVKAMQDFGTHSTHDFGMLLFGSDKILSPEVAIKVFYSVHSVNVVYDRVPLWLLEQ